MKKSCLILSFLCAFSISYGQSGCFTFQTDTIGCAPFRVRVINCFTPGEAVSYNFDLTGTPTAWFQAPISNNGDTSTVYTQPGKYVFAQAPSGQFNNPFRRIVRVYDQNVKPQYQLNFCLGSLSITLPDTIFKEYVVQVAGVDYPKPSSNTLIIPIDFGPGETLKTVPFVVRGVFSSNCGDNAVADTAIVYNSQPILNIDTVSEDLEGSISAFSLNATAPALSRVRVAIRDQLFSWDTTITMPAESERLVLTKAYLEAKQPTFSILISESCPGNTTLKDSITGVLPRLATESGRLKIELPATDDPFPTVKAELNRALFDSLPSPYLAGTYSFAGETGCQKNNCLRLWFTDMDGGRPSVFQPDEQCVTLTGTQGKVAQLVGSEVRGNEQLLFFGSDFAVQTAFIDGVESKVSDSGRVKVVTGPYKRGGCYQVTLKDSCGFGVSPLSPPCALRLSLVRKTHLAASLSWSRPRPVKSPISSFRLLILSATGDTINSIVTTDTVFSDQSNYPEQPVHYLVEGYPTDQAIPNSLSEVVPVLREEKVVLPSAFSPNGDGANDSLAAYVFNLKTFTFKITNRWGEVIHTQEQTAAQAGRPKSRVVWDGKFKGRVVPSGQYFATIIGKTFLNQRFTSNQVVHIIQ